MSAPAFTTYKDVDIPATVDVEIEPDELEKAGWVYVGEPGAAAAAQRVRQWHDEAHSSPWRFCEEEPCRRLR